ncbi:hypothetical protein UA45_08780 [Morganella morganii]|uniref:Uncharacterized protein n=1 Tax=Morganella morganii TaxID=582 RepID=A0A0D8L7Y2_MORMO|nr:hypothetical protein UA45_08780 [Morganella morganii]
MQVSFIFAYYSSGKPDVLWENNGNPAKYKTGITHHDKQTDFVFFRFINEMFFVCFLLSGIEDLPYSTSRLCCNVFSSV